LKTPNGIRLEWKLEFSGAVIVDEKIECRKKRQKKKRPFVAKDA
jgi:hypothetical protein